MFHASEKIITGTFLEIDQTEGAFLSVLDESNNILLTVIVSDEPLLIHLRDVKDSVFYGTGFGGEYFRQISWKNGVFDSTYIDYGY